MAVWQAGRFVNACIVVWAFQATTITGCVIPEPLSSPWSSTPASPTWAPGVPPETTESISTVDPVTIPASSTAAPSGLWEATWSQISLTTSLSPALVTPMASTPMVQGTSSGWSTIPPTATLSPGLVTPMTSTPVVRGTTSSRSSDIPPTATLSPVGHFVEVGENHQQRPGEGLFFPAQIDAEREDLIKFRIHGPYELYLSSLGRPCDSILPFLNDRAVENASSVFNFVVLDTDPIWFYTSRAGGSEPCSSQSVFAVNPGESGATFRTNANLGSGLPPKA